MQLIDKYFGELINYEIINNKVLSLDFDNGGFEFQSDSELLNIQDQDLIRLIEHNTKDVDMDTYYPESFETSTGQKLMLLSMTWKRKDINPGFLK